MSSLIEVFAAPPQRQKVYQWGNPIPVIHAVSYASTLSEFLSAPNNDLAFNPDYSRLYGHPNPDLLDPPDGYTFYEYSDYDDLGRYAILTCRVAWAVERLPANYLTPTAVMELNGVLKSIAKNETEDGWAATERAAAALRKCMQDSETARKVEARKGPQPARPGHLMAEGRALSIAKETINDGNRMGRKVVFSEPVNAFTMLHGDSIAHGGDMLTAVTITDTQEHMVQTYSGRMEARYHAHAVNI